MPIPDDSSQQKEDEDSIDSSEIDTEINKPIEEQKSPNRRTEEIKQRKRDIKAERKSTPEVVQKIESDSPPDTMTHQGKIHTFWLRNKLKNLKLSQSL